jgi:hypothetical protein
MSFDITGIGSVLDFAGKIIDRVFPDPAARDAAKFEMFKAQQAGDFKEMEQEFELAKAQIGVNAVEAASSSLFVSGWRPFVGWTCGFSLMYVGILEPMARFVATVILKYIGPFPVIDTTVTLQVLFGLLGLGGMRTYEKMRGVASK